MELAKLRVRWLLIEEIVHRTAHYYAHTRNEIKGRLISNWRVNKTTQVPMVTSTEEMQFCVTIHTVHSSQNEFRKALVLLRS